MTGNDVASIIAQIQAAFASDEPELCPELRPDLGEEKERIRSCGCVMASPTGRLMRLCENGEALKRAFLDTDMLEKHMTLPEWISVPAVSAWLDHFQDSHTTVSPDGQPITTVDPTHPDPDMRRRFDAMTGPDLDAVIRRLGRTRRREIQITLGTGTSGTFEEYEERLKGHTLEEREYIHQVAQRSRWLAGSSILTRQTAHE